MDWNTTEKNTQHDSPVHVHIEEDPGDSDGIEIPSCLIVANVTDSVFQGGSDRDEFEKKFSVFGSTDFIYLKSFKRVLVNYQYPECAALAKLALHFTDFQEKELRVYFKQQLPWKTSESLEPPKPQKQFFISPPASPPVGWEPIEEPIPVINYDLLSAVASLSPEETHELHPSTDSTPGIIVHGCENPMTHDGENEFHPLRSLPREITQTSRPPIRH